MQPSRVRRPLAGDPAFLGITWDADRVTIVGGERTEDGRIVPVYRLPDGREAAVDLGRL